MSFMNLAKERYSVRSFKSDEIEEKKIAKILEAARIAPTARNIQPHKIYVLKSPESLDKVNKLCNCIYGAPLVFVVGYDKTRISDVNEERVYGFAELDTAIVTTHMMLEATELGLGSCWVGLFSDNEIRQAFDISDDIRITALLPVGYAAEGSVPHELHDTFRPDDEVVVRL